MIGPQAPSSSFESLIKEMNFKGEPKTLRNVKSRFKQFKRYIDQGENDKYQEKIKKNEILVIKMMRTGISLNMTNHKVSMEGTVEQVGQNITLFFCNINKP